ncbi:hypoxanthine phosphoribosyltransferase [Fodinisporobacter ferrooxydans]|uniref:Hypoxanthine phosphoribosyltransferase n=1 Tax=Fodinisporobacter ferrooxydans TaxID=2901836 RepID=A0ABY4CRH9_9BACL|nr:hypoxanthine phosphoribosyltransferase [Alicyclobacillaceae bacterium MYW30-H2]
MQQDILEVLFTEEMIQDKVRELGAAISRDYTGKSPLFICILKGAVMFMADLAKRTDIPLEMDFMAISSYGDSTKSSGVVRILKDLDKEVEGRDLIIVEDIIDSGLTLSYLRNLLLQRNAKSIRIVTLFDKPEGRTVNISPNYFGFQVPNRFIVGYGLDYADKYRNLPYVGILRPEVYSH